MRCMLKMKCVWDHAIVFLQNSATFTPGVQLVCREKSGWKTNVLRPKAWAKNTMV